MPTAYKLPGAGAIVAEYLQLLSETEVYKDRITTRVKHKFGDTVRAEFDTQPTVRGIRGIILRPNEPGDLPDGWISDKRSKAVIPDTKYSAAQQAAKGWVERLSPPTRQEGDVITETGLPPAFFQFGTALVPQWQAFDDSLWVLVPSITETSGPSGAWEKIGVTEYSEAVEECIRKGKAIIRGR